MKVPNAGMIASTGNTHACIWVCVGFVGGGDGAGKRTLSGDTEVSSRLPASGGCYKPPSIPFMELQLLAGGPDGALCGGGGKMDSAWGGRLGSQDADAFLQVQRPLKCHPSLGSEPLSEWRSGSSRTYLENNYFIFVMCMDVKRERLWCRFLLCCLLKQQG